MVRVSFFPVEVAYKVVEDKPVVLLFGRTIDGQQICVVDSSFEPYFYAIAGVETKSAIKKASITENDVTYEVTKVEEVVRKLNEKETNMLKVFVNLPKGVPRIRNVVKDLPGVDGVYEYDISFAKRYLVDKGIIPMTRVVVEGEAGVEKVRVPVINAFSVKPVGDETLLRPRILAVDIEVYNPEGKNVDSDRHPIIMLALHAPGYNKVITWKRFLTSEPYIEFVKSEVDLLERFKKLVEEYQPDIITGYFTDGFDFPYIHERAKKYKLKLDLGLDFSELRVTGRTNKKAAITGVCHVDIFKFIRHIMSRTVQTDILTLDAIAQELLGIGKQKVNMDRLAEAWDLCSDELGSFCRYNLHDAKLVYDLCEKILPNMIELMKIVGQPLFDISRMTYSQLVEWYCIRQAFMANELVPPKPSRDEEGKRFLDAIKGAFVFEPKPGFYKNIAVFDYRSLYPTIIAAHNISPGTLKCSCCEGQQQIETGRGTFWYCKKHTGFISSIIEDLITRRARIKELLKDEPNTMLLARSDALKYLTNSFYGYFGYAGARWYCIECAESVTAWGRQYLHKVINRSEEEGFKVLYSDTDSVFLHLDKKQKEDVEKFAEKINMELPELMELEYEGFYPAGIFVPLKAAESGAKKKYALVDEKGVMKIKGFETVRRNWSPVARDVQREVLDLVLREQNPEKAKKYVHDIMLNLRDNKLPIEKVVIHTQLQKPIENYESIGPHVAAAMRMKQKGMPVQPGTLIQFVVVKGSGKVRDKVRLPEEIKQEDYDADYYIQNQIIPGLERIFSVLGIDISEMALSEKQKSLEGFG